MLNYIKYINMYTALLNIQTTENPYKLRTLANTVVRNLSTNYYKL